ncbi:ATP-binding protein [Actinoplanes sp. CA-142083]|uniref:ATP-binding protein n=1 Tax=Actinoplanes sp. CA-142083 TaxID=3239903 RepID=UPI003D926359
MSFQPSTRPPEQGELLREWVLDSYEELGRLRASLFAALTGQPMPAGGVLDEIPEKVAVVATELATNALTHAGRPTLVCLRRTATTFILEVVDDDIGAVPRPKAPDAHRAGGFGTHIVDDLAGALGWYRDETTKRVWAQFPIPHAD